MENDKAQNTSAKQDAVSGGEVHGRTHNSQNPAFENEDTPNDISNIDQQEGTMNNGECGANLKPNEKNQ